MPSRESLRWERERESGQIKNREVGNRSSFDGGRWVGGESSGTEVDRGLGCVFRATAGERHLRKTHSGQRSGDWETKDEAGREKKGQRLYILEISGLKSKSEENYSFSKCLKCLQLPPFEDTTPFVSVVTRPQQGKQCAAALL